MLRNIFCDYCGTGTTINNYLYNGEQFDANTGFYYLRARYMNPSTGTFISMDPAQGSIFDPVSLHKYLYANANPVMNRDPSGKFSVLEMVTAMTMQAAIGAVCGRIVNEVMYLIDGGKNPQELENRRLTGAIGGAIFGAVFGAFGSIFAQTGFLLGAQLLAGICAILGVGSSAFFASKAYQAYKDGNILGAAIYGLMAAISLALSITALNSIIKSISGSSGAGGTSKGTPEDMAAGSNNYPSTRQALNQDLISKGYTASAPSPEGYVVYKGPDGARVTIKPTGEVISTQRVPVDPLNTAWNSPKYNQRVFYDGTPIPDGAHTTGHFVELFSK